MHPQIVHFTIVLTIVGVAFRLLSFVRQSSWFDPAARTLVILAALTAFVSVRTGTAAHGPVERVPGSRPAVTEHEEAGERAQFILIALGVVELLGFAMRGSKRASAVNAVAAVAGLVAVFGVYEAGKHGGDLVYGYAGGVGIRSGDPKDVERLLLAGEYHQAMADRAAGRSQEAATLIAAAAKQFSSDPEVKLLAAESLMIDQKNPQAALDALAQIQLPEGNRILGFRKATLMADAYEAAGQKDQAIQALEGVLKTFPNPRLQQRVDKLKGGS